MKSQSRSRSAQKTTKSRMQKESLSPEVQDLITQKEELIERESLCMEKGSFQEAHLIMQDIKRLDRKICDLRGEQLQAILQEEQREVEVTNQRELQQFNQRWNSRLQQQQGRSSEILNQLQRKHNQRLQDINSSLQKAECPKVKYSRDYLTSKKHFQSLKRNRQYIEAEHVAQVLQEMASKEEDKWKADFVHHQRIRFEEFLKKLELQKQALEKKLQTQHAMLLKEKEVELEQLLKKFMKKRRDMQGRHQQLRSKQQISNNRKLSVVNTLRKDKISVADSRIF